MGLAAFNLALLPALHAQNTQPTPQNPTGSQSDTKIPADSPAQTRDANTGMGATAASAPDNTGSKTGPGQAATPLDQSPSTASTDSANQSATKDPTLANTQGDKMSSSESHSSHRFSDRHFLVKAAEGGMAEVQLGQLAQSNGSTSDVKDFGARMVKDHSAANDELKALAQQKGIDVPSQLDAKDQADYDSLSKLSGPAFDKAYVQDMVKAHKTDVALFKRASASAQDPDVKDFASKTLPTLEDHLSHVKMLQSQVK
jgi:putative membrane protein